MSALETRFAVLLFTDLVGSADLKARHGVPVYTAALRTHNAHFERIARECRGLRILQNMGDGYFAEGDSVAEVVKFALLFQDAMRAGPWGVVPLTTRVGIHAGEISAFEVEGGSGIVAPAADLAARVMSLALGGQILLTRFPFDEARHFLREHPPVAGKTMPPLRWLAHGPYLLSGRDEAMDIFEVGADGLAPLVPPPDGEKAKRAIRPGEEETLGWRPAVALEIPSRIGWHLSEKLGAGGFGEVWVGEHAKLHQRRAFKFCFDDERLRALKREVTLVRLLRTALGDRDDIVRIHELKLDVPPFYLESDLAPHGNLLQWAEKQGGLEKIPLAQRIALVAHTATALAAAHSIGVLHKDIKPTNILIFDGPGGEPRPRLVDFGIGALANPDVLEEHGITDPTRTVADIGHSSGTPTYSPPEYLAGKPFTIQGDIFALGVLLYQLLTIKPLEPLAHGWERDVADPLLRADIAACVDGDPARRLPSAADLAERLLRLDARRAEAEQAKQRVAALERRAYRRGILRTTAVAAAVVAVVMAAGLYGLNRSSAAKAAQADARQKLLHAGLSELSRLTLGNAANRRQVALEWIKRMKPASEVERRNVAAAYVPILELDDWQVENGALHGPALQAVEDATGQFTLAQETDGSVTLTDGAQAAPVWEKKAGKDGVVLAVSARGKSAAIAQGKEVRIFEGASGAELARVEMDSEVKAIAWHPDGNQLAVGREADSGRGVIELCDGPEWKPGQRIERAEAFPFSRRPLGLAYSPDGTWLAHWSLDSLHLLVWHVAERRVVAFASHPATVLAVAWVDSATAEGTGVLFTAAADAFVYRWEIERKIDKMSREPVALDYYTARFPMRGVERQGHHCAWTHLAALEGDKYLAAADREGSAWCFDVKTGATLVEARADEQVLAFGSDRRQISLMRRDGQTQRLWLAPSLVKRTYWSRQIGVVEDFDILPDGSACAYGGAGGLAVFIEGVDRPKADKSGYAGAYCRGVRFVDEKRLIYSDRAADRMLVIEEKGLVEENLPTGNPFARPVITPDSPARIAFDAARKHLLVARAGSILWAPFPVGESVAFPCEDAAPQEVAISPAGKAFAWTDTAGRAWICDPAQGKPRTLPGSKGRRVAFLGNSWCAISTEAGSHLYAVESLAEGRIEGLDLADVTDIALQQDGTLAAVALRSGGIVLGTLEQTSGRLGWRALATMGTLERGVFSRVRFSGGDRWLGGVSRDGRLHAWDLGALQQAWSEAGCLPDKKMTLPTGLSRLNP